MNERTCAVCDGSMAGRRRDAKFCGKSCKDKDHRQRHLDERRAKDRAYRERNIEQVRAAGREYAERNREQLRAAQRERWPERRARQSAARREWYAATAEQRRAYSQSWRKANPDRVALNNHARRATRKAAGVFVITEQDWRRLVERYRGCCAYCGKPPADGVLHREHVIPIVRGGRHSIGNLVPACQPCNYSKNRLFLTEWRHREGVLARAY